jgi:hypothetical protein
MQKMMNRELVDALKELLPHSFGRAEGIHKCRVARWICRVFCDLSILKDRSEKSGSIQFRVVNRTVAKRLYRLGSLSIVSSLSLLAGLAKALEHPANLEELLVERSRQEREHVILQR